MANAPTNSEKSTIFQDAWYGEPAELHAQGVVQILDSLNLDEATLVGQIILLVHTARSFN